MSVLAIIPARGGSKEVPLKNIKSFAGKPLLVYAIQAAKASGLIDRLITSTDSEEIADVANQNGCEVMFRPDALARDGVPTELALLHVMDKLQQEQGDCADIIVTLEPTSPFRKPATIDRVIGLLYEHPEMDAALTVLETRESLGKIVAGRFEFLVKNAPRRRQEREPFYRECGVVYATRAAALRQTKFILGRSALPVVITEEEAFDINSAFDFTVAEALLASKLEAVK